LSSAAAVWAWRATGLNTDGDMIMAVAVLAAALLGGGYATIRRVVI
jgi:hypothetical protein